MSKSASSRTWIRRHVRDQFVRKARTDGYRSRAAYKLRELLISEGLAEPGACIVDLGTAPGGWAQVAKEFTVPGGKVVGIDLLEVASIQGVTLLRGDVRDEAVQLQIIAALDGRSPDLVISDMAPNLTGIAPTDQARWLALADAALAFAVRWLNPGGSMLVKLFHGVECDGYVQRARGFFKKVAVRKPVASRSESRESYLVATGRFKA